VVRVQDVMTTAVETIAAGSPADRAFDRMRAKGIHHLVVADGARVVGIFSDRDAGGRRGAALREGRTVGELMTPTPVTVRPEIPVRRAANVMRGRAIGSLVVTDQAGRLKGIVTVADLLELLGRGATHPVITSTRWTLSHRAPHRKTHGGSPRW